MSDDRERLAFGTGGSVKRAEPAESAEKISRREREEQRAREASGAPRFARRTNRQTSDREPNADPLAARDRSSVDSSRSAEGRPRLTPSAPSALGALGERSPLRPPSAREPQDWAFTWTLLFTAALFLRPQDLIPPLAILHLPEVTAIGGLASLFSGRLRRRQPLTRLTPELVGVVLLGVVILVTAPFSIWIGGSLHVFVEMYSKVILIFLLAINVISSPRRLERFTWVLVLTVSYVALLSAVDYARGVNTIGHGTRVRGAVSGVLGNPNDLALNMVSFLPLVAFFAMRPGSILRRAIAAFCAVLMVAAIVASGSRGGFLGFAAMTLVLAGFAIRRRPAFVIAGALAALCALPLVPSNYWLRLASITNQRLDPNGSEQARRELIKESFHAFLENPLTGVGAGQFVNWKPDERIQAAHEAHDVFLQVGADLGVVGLAVFVFLVWRAFLAVYQTRRLIRRARPRRPRFGSGPPEPTQTVFDDQALQLLDAHSAAMAAAITGWLVCALFGSVAYNWTFYYLLVLAVTPRDMLRDALPARARAWGRVRAIAPEAARA